MPNISVSEKDFEVLACAAGDAEDRGDMKQAKALDKLARKTNAALTAANGTRKLAAMWSGNGRPVRWQDMPSTLSSKGTENA